MSLSDYSKRCVVRQKGHQRICFKAFSSQLVLYCISSYALCIKDAQRLMQNCPRKMCPRSESVQSSHPHWHLSRPLQIQGSKPDSLSIGQGRRRPSPCPSEWRSPIFLDRPMLFTWGHSPRLSKLLFEYLSCLFRTARRTRMTSDE